VLPRGPLPSNPTRLLDQVIGGDAPDVILLGPGPLIHDAIALAALFDEQLPAISVVLATDPDSDTWLAAMRVGVRDVLAPNSGVEEIRVVLDRAMQVAVGHRNALGISVEGTRSGQVIAVVSPKGGTGKTTVATNLAVGLARHTPNSTVIVDLDLQFGDVASALQLVPEYFLTDVVGRPASQDAMVLKSFLTWHPSGLYALCAPETPAEADDVTGEQTAQLLALLVANFQYVVVDTAPGLGDHALAALEIATDIVLVSGLDVPSVRGLRKEIDVLAQLKLTPRSQRVLLNAADRRGGMSVKDVEASIGTTVDLVLPASKAVLLSTNQGVPLLQTDARGPVAKELRRLVEHLATEQSAPSDQAPHATVSIAPRRRSGFHLRGGGAEPRLAPVEAGTVSG
jgi:pilus assembly protein CpaE